MMTPIKNFWRLIPWILLTLVFGFLYFSSQWPFGSRASERKLIVESSVLLHKIESLGKLELVQYNFSEVIEYKRLSNGKIIGNSILNMRDYEPDLSVLLVASGKAVGCIDLTKMEIAAIKTSKDSVVVQLPAPELCYHKLDLQNTRVFSESNESWWSKLFSDENEKQKTLELAYRDAESRLEKSAVNSGIYQSTNENAIQMLNPMLEQLSGKKVLVRVSLPAVDLNNIGM